MGENLGMNIVNCLKPNIRGMNLSNRLGKYNIIMWMIELKKTFRKKNHSRKMEYMKGSLRNSNKKGRMSNIF